MRRFSYFKRSNSGIYFVQFKDPATGARMSPRSLGTRDKDEALLKISDWLHNGIPVRGEKAVAQPLPAAAAVEAAFRAFQAAPFTKSDALRIVELLRKRELIAIDAREVNSGDKLLFGAWLQDFWKYESSQYIRERLAHGQRITKRHCQDMLGRAREISRYLGDELTLGQVRRSHLVSLGLKLREKGLAPATVNKTMSAVTTALRWASANELLAVDPSRGLRGFSGTTRKRGILEPKEVKALFSTIWRDQRARVACLVAATTGARLGEILALRHEDIGDKLLFIRHSYSIRDGLKSTKNGEERKAPLLPAVRKALFDLESKSRHVAGPERFVFAGRDPDKPVDGNRILSGLRRALVSMNGKEWDDEKERTSILTTYRARGIDFHSWRHYYAKHMADKLEARAVQRVTGHKTGAMLEHYADHEEETDLQRVADVAQAVFFDFTAVS
ncbi:MAG TPA: tyrosine-type recombinase/integrase [Rectinemataceae bacterium]|nr:tyrosine-type recombinase/integrase [Rectinemataceae bacterium]